MARSYGQRPDISSHTVQQWIDEFKRLKKLNEQIIAKPAGKSAGAKTSPKLTAQPTKEEKCLMSFWS